MRTCRVDQATFFSYYQVQLILANVFRSQMLWRLVEKPSEVCHGCNIGTDRQPRIIPQPKILDHSLAQFCYHRFPFQLVGSKTYLD